MKNFIHFCLAVLLLSLSGLSFADAYVCTDAQGHRSFSNAPCESKGLQQASKQTVPTSPKVINAMVIAEKRHPEAQDPSVLPGQIKMDRKLDFGTPATVFLLSMMFATACLFGLLFMRFFRAHHSALSLKRADRE